MDNTKNRLTGFFENPFWVGVFEKYKNGKLKVAKVTFGAEPKDTEVYAFILKHYYDLRYSPALDAVIKEDAKKIRNDCKEKQKNRRRQKASEQNHSRHCNCSTNRTKPNARQKAVSGSLPKPKDNMSCGSAKKTEKHNGH